jgi:hypothetical protein
MSCPDATPEWGEVAELERQAKAAYARVIGAKNEKYMGSAKFWEDVEELYKACVSRGKAETLEEKITAAISGVKRTNSLLAEEQWKPRRGTC